MSPSPVLTPNKRRRVTLACRSCRQRKQRCSGDRPCSLCNELGLECVYQDGGISGNLTIGKSFVVQLEQRLSAIEASVRQLQETCKAGSPELIPGDINGGNDSSGNRAQVLDSNVAEICAGANAQGPDIRSEIGEIDVSENAIDGMGAINFTDEQDCGFFGPSSNIAFMRHISRAIAQANTSNPSVLPIYPSDQRGGGMVSISRPPSVGPKRGTNASSGVNIYALPPEERMWSLIRQYFYKTGQLLPFIHEPAFCETYFQMKKENFTRVRRTWLGLLNIILAIATSLSTEAKLPAEKRIQESDVYYQRANGLCDRDSRRNASLEMVQYLLILGQYLQGTQKSVQAWTTHSLAISVAFQLGLHSPDANQQFPPLECEIRKRTWFGCILLDRTLSMTFGRPCTIPESYVKLELPERDMQVLNYIRHREDHPQLDGLFFTAAIKLYVIMFNVLSTCYGQNLGFEHSTMTVPDISRILEGERQLEDWHNNVLPSLGMRIWHRLSPEDIQKMHPESVIKNRFTIVLTVRYHNLRILLYRKSLESLLRSSTLNPGPGHDSRLIQQFSVTGVQNCVDSAISIISAVHAVTLSDGWRRELLGAWNYSLYYMVTKTAFNAGLVIFAAILVASKERVKDPSSWSMVDQARPYLDWAIEALRRLDSGNRVIGRCSEYLSQLSVILNASRLTEATVRSGAMVNLPIEYGADMFSTHDSEALPRMDLGEFMIDSDFDFLGRLFNQAQQGR